MQARSAPRDANLLAISIVEDAKCERLTDRPTAPEPPAMNPHAQALARFGASKGGKARAVKLRREQRQEIGRRAARARWTREVPGGSADSGD